MQSTNDLLLALDQLAFDSYPSPAAYPSKYDRSVALTEYQNKVNALVSEWKTWLFDDYASHLNAAQQEVLYTKAYADGHSNGYREIENEFAELAELATSLFSLGK